jgi:hypothetical protein
MYYSGAEALDISPNETFSAAEFNYKQLAGNVTINGLEQIQNSGKEAVHNLLKSRIRNLEKSLNNAVATGLYADGAGLMVYYTDNAAADSVKLTTTSGVVDGGSTWRSRWRPPRRCCTAGSRSVAVPSF